MMSTVTANFQNLRGTTAQWATSTTILKDGQLGWDKELNIVKLGDGVTQWLGLPIVNHSQGFITPAIDLASTNISVVPDDIIAIADLGDFVLSSIVPGDYVHVSIDTEGVVVYKIVEVVFNGSNEPKDGTIKVDLTDKPALVLPATDITIKFEKASIELSLLELRETVNTLDTKIVDLETRLAYAVDLDTDGVFDFLGDIADLKALVETLKTVLDVDPDDDPLTKNAIATLTQGLEDIDERVADLEGVEIYDSGVIS
jgi:hypothetical protein